MQTFKKFFISITSFILFFVIISTIVIVPYYNSEAFYYEDNKLRDSLAGKIDFIIIGASHALSGFVPNVIDDKLNCNSYNLSCSMLGLESRKILLEKEIDRNPVKTVVLELSNDSLIRDMSNEYAIGDEPFLAKLPTYNDKISYMLNNVKLDDWLNVYSRSMYNGMVYWAYKALGRSVNNVNYEYKGYHPKESNNIYLDDSSIVSSYNEKKITSAYHENNLEIFNSIVQMLHSKNIRVIIAVVPISDQLIWRNDNQDVFTDFINKYGKENDCEVYDFNLLKNRNELLSDKFSFSDLDHMCDDGAKIFTNEFCKIINMVNNGERVDDLFYNSYEDLKNDMEYMEIYSNENITK